MNSDSTVYKVNSLDLNNSSSSRTSIIRVKYFKPYAVHRYKIFILYQDEKKMHHHYANQRLYDVILCAEH